MPAGPIYSCCLAEDVNREYRPGETLTAHWIVSGNRINSGEPVPHIELDAHLSGPFATIEELKASSAADRAVVAFAAEPVAPSGLAGEQPVSVIAIPTTARPGYYNLVTAVREPGGSVSAGSVIRVVSRG